VGHGTRFAVAQGHRRGPRMGSLKSQRRTSYLSSIRTIGLNSVVFEKIAICVHVSGDRRIDEQTDKQMNSIIT